MTGKEGIDTNGKAFLQNILDVSRKIDRVLEEKEWQKNLACRATSRAMAVRYGGTTRRSKVEEAVVRMVDCDREADRLIDRLTDMREQARALIGCVGEERPRRVLMWRYVEGLCWEDIQGRLGGLHGGAISRKTAYNLHGMGLRAFEPIFGYYHGQEAGAGRAVGARK